MTDEILNGSGGLGAGAVSDVLDQLPVGACDVRAEQDDILVGEADGVVAVPSGRS